MLKFMRAEPGERGQALIVMVFAVIALLVMAGLAIDGGMVFLERRRMQNASDAAALAGTRRLAGAICDDSASSASADAAIHAEVNKYAEKNGVPDTDATASNAVNDNVVADYVNFDEVVLGRVGNGSIPNGATGVSVTVEINRPTYFVSLVGIDTAGASAAALAMTGRPLMAGGLRPFGIPEEVVRGIDPNGDDPCFTIKFGNCNTPGVCNVTYSDGQLQHRGWLNLAYVWHGDEDPTFPRAITQNPTGQLKDWMENGWSSTYPGPCGAPLCADAPFCAGAPWPANAGDYIHAKPGTEQDVINVAPGPETNIVVPVYDKVVDCDENEDELSPYPENPNACTGMMGASYYHIVGFAGVNIDSTNTSDHSMHLCLKELIIAEGAPSPSAGYGSDVCAMHTMVVTLWK